MSTSNVSPEPARESLASWFEFVPCGLLLFTDDGWILDVNTTLAGWLGIPREELLGQHLDVILPPGGRIFFQTHFSPLLRSDQSVAEIYFALKRKDSTQLPVLIDARRVGESGKYSNIASFVVVNNRQQFEGALLRALRSEQAAREETERKSAELDGVNVELRQHRDALIAAEAELRRSNESKDEFIGLVAHELKNPLSILSGTVSIVARRVADQPLDETRHTLEELHGEFARLLLVIENLLGVARSTMADSSELEPLILPRLVSRLVSRADLAIGPGGPIVVQAEPDLPLVLGSEPLVVQILHNFLTNARKYGTDGSEITVSIRRSGDTVEIAVANDGEDLDEREVARFFEAFFRAEGHRGRVQGTGLGLTVCQRLAAAQGGSVAARPRPNGGLEVTLSLRVLHEDDEPD